MLPASPTLSPSSPLSILSSFSQLSLTPSPVLRSQKPPSPPPVSSLSAAPAPAAPAASASPVLSSLPSSPALSALSLSPTLSPISTPASPVFFPLLPAPQKSIEPCESVSSSLSRPGKVSSRSSSRASSRSSSQNASSQSLRSGASVTPAVASGENCQQLIPVISGQPHGHSNGSVHQSQHPAFRSHIAQSYGAFYQVIAVDPSGSPVLRPVSQQPRDAASNSQSGLPAGYIGYPMYAPMIPSGYGYCAADYMGALPAQQPVQPVQAIYYG